MNAPIDHVREIVAANRDAYRRIAAVWSGMEGKDLDVEFRAECRCLFASRLPGPRVLDLGCGRGQDAMKFAAAGLKTTAADIVTEFLSGIRARQEGASVTVAAMDMTRPCFAPESFDGIFAFASFLHVPREAAAETIEGCHRMLAPGGVLFLHHAASRLGLEGYPIESLLGMSSVRAEAFCHSEEEMTIVLEKAGFDSMETYRLPSAKRPSSRAFKFGLEPYQILAHKA